jgi:hypothetical protein
MSAETPGGRRTLRPHPTSAAGAVKELSVAVARPSPFQLSLDYRLVGDLSQLRLPEPRTPVRSDGLWRHTCFEAFVGRPPAADYWEYNFSPSAAWAAYHFTAYREGMAPLMKGAPPAIDARIAGDVFELAVHVDLSWLSRSPHPTGLRLALSAVIEDKERVLSYWALEHPGEKPDFHHAAGQVVVLD